MCLHYTVVEEVQKHQQLEFRLIDKVVRNIEQLEIEEQIEEGTDAENIEIVELSSDEEEMEAHGALSRADVEDIRYNNWMWGKSLNVIAERLCLSRNCVFIDSSAWLNQGEERTKVSAKAEAEFRGKMKERN